MWQTRRVMLGGQGDAADDDWERNRQCALLQATLGELGLRAWADVVPVLRPWCPDAADRCVRKLQAGSQAAAPRFRVAAGAGILLDNEGWQSRPQ